MLRQDGSKNARAGLLWAAGLYLLLAVVGTLVAVRENLPAGFLGILNGQDPLRDFALIGTGLSAPLAMLVVQAVLMFGLFRGLRPGVCRRGLIVLGCMYLVGQAGEPVVWQAFVPVLRPGIAALGVANLLCPLAMIVLGLRASE